MITEITWWTALSITEKDAWIAQAGAALRGWRHDGIHLVDVIEYAYPKRA